MKRKLDKKRERQFVNPFIFFVKKIQCITNKTPMF